MAKILIVEAESANRRLAAAALKQAGHEVIEVSRGTRGVRIAVQEQPDLVLVDALLPDMDGGQFVRTLWSAPSIEPPRVMFRASSVIGAEARALADSHKGFFVVKHLDAESLRAEVTAALSTPAQVPEVSPLAPEQASELWRRLTRKLSTQVEKLVHEIDGLKKEIDKNRKKLDVAHRAVDREIKKRHWAERELERVSLMLKDQTMRDLATGLHNRRFLEESLQQETYRAGRHHQAFALMIIDIDDLQTVKSRFGHDAGDAVVEALGEHVRSLVRNEDIVARYGPGEFALLMSCCPGDTARNRAAKLRDSAGHLMIEHKGRPIGAVSLSVGIGVFPDHGNSSKALLHAAEQALGRARQAGQEPGYG